MGQSLSVSLVKCLAFSPDGKLLAGGGGYKDCPVVVWSTETDNKVFRLDGHTESIRSVTFSPDGKFLASGSGDATVKLWDMTTGRKAKDISAGTYKNPGGLFLNKDSGAFETKEFDLPCYIYSVSFSPDGRLLAAGNHSLETLIWNVDAGQGAPLRIHVNKGMAQAIFSPIFSPKGATLAIGDQGVKLVDATTGKVVRQLEKSLYGISCLAFSPDGRLLAAGTAPSFTTIAGDFPGVAKVWNVETGQEALTLKGNAKGVLSVAFSSDGKMLATGSREKIVKIWDAATGQEMYTLECKNTIVAFSPDSKRLATGDDSTINLWEIRSDVYAERAKQGEAK
jgi:WD40 repeat protein